MKELKDLRMFLAKQKDNAFNYYFEQGILILYLTV